MSDYSIRIILDGKNNIGPAFKGAAADVAALKRTTTEFGAATSMAGRNITQGLTPAMNGINTSKLEQLGMQMTKSTTASGRLKSAMGNLKGSVSNLTGSMGGLGGVMTGLIGIGIASWVVGAVHAAVEADTQWKMFAASMKSAGVDATVAKKQITALAETNGFLVNDTRDATKSLVQSGQSYQQVTKNQGDLTTAMALSIATHKGLQESSVGLVRAYDGNGRALKALGINVADYKNKMTGKIDVDKLNAAILAKTQPQLEAYRKSYQAQMNDFSSATESLKESVGEALLPTLTATVKVLTGMANGFSNLSPNVQKVILGVVGFTGAMVVIGTVIGPLKNVYNIFKDLKGVISTAISKVSDYVSGLSSIPKTKETVITQKTVNEGGGVGGKGEKTVEKDAEGGAIGGAGLAGLGTAATVTVIAGAVTAGTMIGDLGYHLGKDPKNAVYNSLGDLSGGLSALAGTTPRSGASYKYQTSLPVNSFAKWDPVSADKIGKEWNREMGSIQKAWNNTGSYLKGAWGNTVAFITLLGQRIYNRVGVETFNYLKGAWKNTTSYISGAWTNTCNWVKNGINSAKAVVLTAWNVIKDGATNAFNKVMNGWNWLKGVIGGGISTAISIGTSAITDAENAFWKLYNDVKNNKIVQYIITKATSGVTTATNTISSLRSDPIGTIKSGASWVANKILHAGPAKYARGPIDMVKGAMSGMKYENYPGHQKSPEEVMASGSGNCFDLSLTSMVIAGAMGIKNRMVSGEWSGNPHVWSNIGGQNLDFARKSHSGTYSPPPRGPGNGSPTVILQFNQPVYGMDDFFKQVEKGINQITRSTLKY